MNKFSRLIRRRCRKKQKQTNLCSGFAITKKEESDSISMSKPHQPQGSCVILRASAVIPFAYLFLFPLFARCSQNYHIVWMTTISFLHFLSQKFYSFTRTMDPNGGLRHDGLPSACTCASPLVYYVDRICSGVTSSRGILFSNAWTWILN